MISRLGSWAPMYGGTGGSLVYRATEADGDPPSIEITANGYYTFKMDVQKLTYTLAPYTGSTTTFYPTVGIVGNATTGNDNGWNASKAMVNSTFDKHQWRLGSTQLFDGGLKFRANDSWDVNWGGSTAFSGIVPSGDNIPVAKSKYLIYFNDLNGNYIMIPNQ